MKWLSTKNRSLGVSDAEIPADEGCTTSGAACYADAEICTDESERSTESSAKLDGSILEVGGAVAGLTPLEDASHATRRRKQRNGNCRGSKDSCR